MEETQHINIFQKLFAVLTDRMFFTAAYVITALLWSFPLISQWIDIPMKLVFVWGIMLIAYDFFTKRIMFTVPGSLWLVLMGAAYLISIALHPNRLYDGIKHFAYNGIALYILYSYSSEKTDEYYKKRLTVLNDIIIAVIFAASFISMVMFFVNFRMHIVSEYEHLDFTVGEFYNRNGGVYTSANTAALYSILSVGLSCMNAVFYTRHFRRFRWFYIVNLVVQFLMYSTTLSNGGALMLVTAGLCVAVFFLFPHILKKERNKAVAVLMTALCFAGAVFTVHLAAEGARKVLPLIPKAIASMRNEDPAVLEELENFEFDRVDEEKGLENGRVAIWKAGLQLWRKSPVFGAVTTTIYPEDEVLEGVEQEYLVDTNGYLHNAFVQILVCSGAVGFLLFAIFTVYAIRKLITSLIRLQRQACYDSLATVVTLVAMLASQFINEAHLLYHRQDPIALLFWLYLGFAMFYARDKIAPEESGTLFVCGTPYQLQNAVRLAQDWKNCDVFIYEEFMNADAITANVNKMGIFRQTVGFRPFRTYPSLLQKAVTLFRITFPEWNLRRHRCGKIRLHPYETVYLSSGTRCSDSVLLLNPHAKFILYDDGIGSYFHTNIETIKLSRIMQFINRHILNGRLSYRFDKVYLNRPELSASDAERIVEKIPEYEPYAETLKQIFAYRENSFYKENRFVYLTQPLRECPDIENATETDRKILGMLKDRVVVRVHPRQSGKEYANYKCDPYNNLWELECGEQVSDGNVLIGAFSTAQFTPKFMFGKEPWVIFTYPMYGWTKSDIADNAERLRRIYRNPDKVLTAQTVKDLERAIDHISAVEYDE